MSSKDDAGFDVTTFDGENFHHWEFSLSDEQHENVRLAVQRAGEIAGSDKLGHLIDMICLDFLANNADITDLGEKLAHWAEKGLIELEEA